jgi:PAS domain S-box-containing protein
MQQESEYVRSLIEASLDPFITINVNGKITDMNEAFVKITNRRRSDLTGSDFFDYFTEPQKAREGYQEVFAKGFVVDYPLTIRDHKKTDVLFNGSVYKNEQGDVLGVVVVARDITEQKIIEKELTEAKVLAELATAIAEETKHKAEATARYARSLIEASLDPLITISIEGKIMDMNVAFEHITGMNHDDLVGTDFFKYFTDPQKAREGYQEVFAKGYVTDYPLTISDHKRTDVLFNGSVYKDEQGQVLGVVVVARDITEQKRVGNELTEAKVFAEDAQSKAESATRTAENAVRAKQQFLSNMSHEIRTPMNAIIGFTKVLLKTDLSTKQNEYLTAIKMSGDALIVLINDILDLAKVDAGKMTFEKTPFKMASSISAMLHLFETKIQEKNLKLIKQYDSKIPQILVGDPVRLNQIILNLMSNAVKFTTEGKIIVNVNLLSEDEEKVTIEFSVTDTGIGIEENKIINIFENFQQASSATSRLYGGTGLGLAIVKQLVEKQNGTIHVTSKVNEGSSFSFILTYLKTNTEAESVTDIEELNTEIENVKVLVVEDIALNQLLMKTLLDDFGFERDIASNGKIAIEKLQKKSYDIILMDLQMPEMNGFEATEYIRNTMHSSIPIIALTADVTTVDLAKCREVGMNDYISKPVDERILFNKIISWVKKTEPSNTSRKIVHEADSDSVIKCTDLNYLMRRTKSDPVLIMEVIALYLEQTRPLIKSMKQSFHDEDWNLLQSTVHKMIPSFSIMGMNIDFEEMARKIKDYANSQQQTSEIFNMVLKLENVLIQSCKELEQEFGILKNAEYGK